MISERRSGWRWTFIGAAVGAIASSVLTSAFGVDRHVFVAAWAAMVLVLWSAYARQQGVHLRTQIPRHLPGGLIIGTLVGGLLAWTVWRQPTSPAPTGPALVVDLIWLGAVYGSVDALILAVLPVMALHGTRSTTGPPMTRHRLHGPATALVGSVLITTGYHLGFREFQGPQLILPVLGGLATTAAYVLSGSVVAPVLAHVIMHTAAVLHGAATTVQLPPHY